MNIWFFSPNGQPRGPRARIYNYACEMIARGHVVTIFTKSFFHAESREYLEDNESTRLEYVDGIRTVWLRTLHYHSNGWKRAVGEIQFAYQAIKYAKRLGDKPDVIVADSVSPINGLAGEIVARKMSSAFVYQLRDVWPIALVHDGSLKKNSLAYFTFRTIEKYLYRRADWVCSALPLVHDHVENGGGDPNRITYIRNGVDLSSYVNFSRTSSDVLEHSGADSDSIVVMYVGTIAAAHDVISIVRAAIKFQTAQDPRFKFIIYGDGVKKEACVLEAEEHELKNIEFRGMIEKVKIPGALQEADVLIASVLASDAYKFGINLNKLYDYFAAGKAVIFSGKAPNDDVKSAEAGFSIEPENPDRLVEVLKAFAVMPKENRKQLGENARCYAENEYDIRVLADRFEFMLKEAILFKTRQQRLSESTS